LGFTPIERLREQEGGGRDIVDVSADGKEGAGPKKTAAKTLDFFIFSNSLSGIHPE
jgi:hypothetical protein